MAQRQTAEAWAQASLCVALVDDDEQIAEAMALMLFLKGVRACIYFSAESLLSCLSVVNGRLQLRTPEGDVYGLAAAVLDFNLPGVNGIDLLLQLRAMQADLKVVLITAALDSVVRQRTHDLKGVPCLFKPFDLQSLEVELFGS
jgi:FixJ family two-component response regulator